MRLLLSLFAQAINRMQNLKTIFTSNIPMDCHIKKQRLESEGIDCYIFDENLVYADPFSAVAIGGVKLKVQNNQFEKAKAILKSVEEDLLFDTSGEYKLSSALNEDIEIQNEILKLKLQLRKNTGLLNNAETLQNEKIPKATFIKILEEEKEFQRLKKLKFNFSVDDFLADLFTSEKNVMKHFRIRPTEYYIEKDMVDLYESDQSSGINTTCPSCGSENVSYGYAIDSKWLPLYVILSFIFFSPFPLMRKNFHCFECKNDFKKNKETSA